jgi:hypothetical protein
MQEVAPRTKWSGLTDVRQHLTFLGRRLSLLLGGGGVLTVIGIVQLVQGAHHRSAWFWLFLAALLVAIAEVSAVHKAMRAGPQLAFVGTEVEDATTLVTAVMPVTGFAPAASAAVAPLTGGAPQTNRYARVRVANDPGGRIGECARQVATRITFLSDAGKPLLSNMIGRWAETPQRAQTGHFGLTLQESQLDIEANTLPHSLDIAMKVPGADHFYAYNHENSAVIDLRLAKHRIAEAKCRVQVTLYPANGRPVSGTFVLRSYDGDLTLEAEDTPSVTPSRPTRLAQWWQRGRARLLPR